MEKFALLCSCPSDLYEVPLFAKFVWMEQDQSEPGELED